MFDLEIDITGISQLQTVAAGIEDADVGEALEDAATVILNRIRTRFLNETDPDGMRWPPSQAALKRTGGGTLFDTGRLFHSIQLFRRSNNEIAIATDVDYGVYHQFGTATLPQRQFLGFSDDDVEVAGQVFESRLMEILNG